MKGFLRLDVVGNLGRAAELKRVGEGVVCNFSIASNMSLKKRDGSTVERTEWTECAIWGGFGETMAQYLTKGVPVFVSGEPVSREYDDRDGNKRRAVTLNVDKLVLLPGGNRDGQRQAQGDRREEPRGASQRSGYTNEKSSSRQAEPPPDDFGFGSDVDPLPF